jgi:hypothetical protein
MVRGIIKARRDSNICQYNDNQSPEDGQTANSRNVMHILVSGLFSEAFSIA